ncbi:MAG: nitroreductase family protein [Alphaproteobacteria bacterium]
MNATKNLVDERYGNDTSQDVPPELPATVAELLARRCIRRYTEDPIPGDLLDTLLACAQSAPTKSNLQQYSIIVTTDHDMRMTLADLNPDTGHMKYCPVFLTFCADMRRAKRLTERHGYDFANNNMDTFLNATVDAALAMQCFITAAEAAGLGCAPISQVRNRMREFCDALKIPEGVFPIAGLTVGWPAWEGRMNARLPAGAVIHREKYDDSDLDGLVDAYDDRRHKTNPIAPENQRHADKYGTSERCTWSENVARQLSIAERPGFREFLLSNGFDLA